MSAGPAVDIVGGMALGKVLGDFMPRPLLLVAAIAFACYLFRRQIRRAVR